MTIDCDVKEITKKKKKKKEEEEDERKTHFTNALL
jgi:hypothetical protein